MTKNKILQLEKKLTETQAALKRALADYANLEKRVTQEREVIGKISLVNLIVKFLPILDNLDKACEHTRDDGVEMIAKHFRQVLTSFGVKEVGVAGDKFDPRLHEAVEVVQGEANDKIVEVISSGFVIDSLVIRPAKVKVEKTKVEKDIAEKIKKASEFGDYA